MIADRQRNGPRRPADAPIDRRRWLTAVAAVAVSAGAPRITTAQKQEHDDLVEPNEAERAEILAIAQRAQDSGITRLSVRRNDRYYGLGTAPHDFLDGAMRLCEELADDYHTHFQKLGFAVTRPEHRLFLVALESLRQFERFIGAEQAAGLGGVYEMDTNWLILFDNRQSGRIDPGAERANTISLFHEATHQLTFNTGLLDRRSTALPVAIAEGLAMYGEVRRPDGRTRIGALNRERLAVIGLSLRGRGSLIPVSDLISDDMLFDRAEVEQRAYAQSWLLVHGLIRNDKARERFRSYLDALRMPNTPSVSRLDLARQHLGDLEQLDQDLRSYARKLLR